MRASILKMPVSKLREVVLMMLESYPSLVFHVLEPAVSHPGGHHPEEGSAIPEWCVCGKCREMPTEREKVCCERVQCISTIPDFSVLILDEAVLALARMYRQDVLALEEGADISKCNRHAAYRQFVLWQHGRLGVGERMVIPSCCVWQIRDKYPDPFGQYTGFLAARLA